jgi:excisionase family DNA binding protein
MNQRRNDNLAVTRRSQPLSGSDPGVAERIGRAPRRRQREPMQFFTIAKVAECVDVSTRSVRRWIKSGDLVAHHFGGAVRIAEGDFRAFLAMHRDG